MAPTTIAIVIIGWIAGWALFGRFRRVRDLPVTVTPPRPTVIVVPARNEEATLPLLLSDLAHSRPPGAVVFVVDDHSEDATAEVAARYPFVTVVSAPELPPGWTGKSWACWTGVAAAEGTGHSGRDRLVFLDADVRLDEGTLDRVCAEADHAGGAVSVQPWHATERPYEQASALFNLIAPMGVGAGGPGRPAALFGPVISTTFEAYRRAGGHEAVRSEVVEDVALGAAFREAGSPITLLAGAGGIRYRMYPAGFAQLLEGWTKNFAAGAGSTRPMRLAGVVAWIAAGITAASALATTTAEVILGEASAGSAILPGGLYLLVAAQMAVLFRRVGRFGLLTAVAYPALIAVFLAVFARSVRHTHLRRSVEWRGRSITVGAGPPRSS